MIDRYPGARPFADTPNDQRLFFGRSQEIDTLFHRIYATRLLVLFGKSGLGKTSLLQAGVFPRLRERAMLPLPIRLNQTGSPLETITAFAQTVCQSAGIEYIPGEGESLWEFFKTAMFWQGDTLLRPVLVFDQFEELFTLKQPIERTALARELGDLFRGGVPQTMREKRQAGSASPSLGEQPPEVKVVLSLREDYLGALQELTADIPGIFDDRVRLTALTAAQARQAIQEPARLRGDEAAVGSFVTPPFEYTEEALADILDFLKGKSKAIEPFQLQLVCRSVEEQVTHRQGRDNITVGQQDLGGRRRLEAVVRNFYQQAIARLPKRERKRARRLCEDGLLTQEGHRLTLQEGQIKVEYTLSEAALDTLVDARLLRKEPRLESFFYELSHDSLAGPILDSRPWLPRKVRAIARGGLAAMLVLIIFGYYQYQARLAAEAAEKHAREARTTAEEARAAAEQVLEFLTFDLRDKLAPIGRLDIVGDVQKQVDAYYRMLGTEGQGTAVLRRRAVAYHNQGDRLLAQGRLAEAQKAYEDGLAIAQKLTARDPSNTEWQRDLSVSFDRLGNVLRAQGKLGEARKACEDGLAIAQKLTARDPSNTEWQRDLSVFFRKLGDVLSAQGKLGEAQKAYQDGLAIIHKLTAHDPSNTEWQWDLSAIFERLGNVLVSQGKFGKAQKAYQDSLAIRHKLTAHDPSNTEWQRDLSISFNRLGDVLSAQGKLGEAQKAYQDGLAIIHKLTAHDPSNTEWQRDLSISHEKTGNILQAQGKPAEALAAYQKTLAIRERLAAHDPRNAQWQSDLSGSYKQNAHVLFELNRIGEAVAIARRWTAHEYRRVEKSSDAQIKASWAEAYGDLAWYELFNRRPKEAIEAGRKGLEANPGELWVNTINTNLAHGYLFDGQYTKAQAIYLKYKAQKVIDGRSFKQMVLDDFKELRKRGIDHSDIKRIERRLR